MALTALKTKALSEPGRHHDGRGLYLQIAKTGAKSWLLRISIDGRRRDIGLGGYPAVSLAAARQAADAHRATVAGGGDPLADKRREAVPSFEEAARKLHMMLAPRFRSAKHSAEWIASLDRDAFARLGKMPLDRIDRRDVLAVLTPIWTAKPESARRLRQRVRAVLRWAMGHGYVEHNAAGEAIDGALPSMPRKPVHHAALDYEAVPAALVAVEAVEAYSTALVAKLALRFTVLVACRSGEARGATWGEIDLDARIWTVPASRMKGGEPHRVPLSDAALAVLAEARRYREAGDFVFPSPYRQAEPLSDVSMRRAMERAGLRATVHGFRAAFRIWAAEQTNASHAAMELSLSHRVGGAVERAYMRSDLLEQRRVLMQEWGHFVAGPPDPAGNVVPFRKGA